MKKEPKNNMLDYLGIDLNKVPQSIKKTEKAFITPYELKMQKSYKVYRYINVDDIKIFLTNTERIAEANQKSASLQPLNVFLNKKNEEGYNKFLELAQSINIKDIELLEKFQKMLKTKIPTEIKYTKDYLWQIFYSKKAKEYYMVVPMKENDFTALFYVLKKQFEKSKDEIFVPICNIEQSEEYLKSEKIGEIENYLYMFTKNWPMIYETIDKKNISKLNIIGKFYVYENIESDYKITIENEESANKTYKLLKALFLLQTEVADFFDFELRVDENGNLEFYYNNTEVTYDNIASFLKIVYQKAEISIEETKNSIENLQITLDKLKNEEKALTKEFFYKQRQIATYLEYKKTFLGKIKLFFTRRKNNENNIENMQEKVQETETEYKNGNNPDISLMNIYTIEELIKIYKILSEYTNKSNEIENDIEQLTERTELLKKKIENATKYINEIEEHKKSIFEFWKFTNKDDKNELNEGGNSDSKAQIIMKNFDIKEDFEELAKRIDLQQREKLTSKEQDAIFVLTTQVLKDINDIIKGKDITDEILNILKTKAYENIEYKDEIFSSDFNSLQIESSIKHREKGKDIVKILKITSDTSLDNYKNQLVNIIKNIEVAFLKLSLGLRLTAFIEKPEDKLQEISLFNINILNTIREGNKEITIYKLNLKPHIKVLACSNIIYFNNINNTLPLGMNKSDYLILNTKNLQIQEKEQHSINIVKFSDDNSIIKTTKLNIIEIDC